MRKIIVMTLMILLAFSFGFSQEEGASSGEFLLDLSDKPLEMTWEFPKAADTTLNYRDITMKVGFKSDYGITNISLLLNGLPIQTENRGSGFNKNYNPKYDEYIEQNISLNEGGNVLKLVIKDEGGNIEATERTIFVSTADAFSLSDRKDYALLFGTDNYTEWNDLVNPINDTESIAQVLKDHYGFEVEIIKNASQDQVLLKLKDYAKKEYADYDQLLIFFAGHGQFDDLLGQGYIVCTDSRVDDEARSSYISHSVLRNAIDNIPTRHTLLAMDVCFGGTFDPNIARTGSRGDNVYDELSTTEFVKRKLSLKTRKYITSGGKQYVPDGRPGMHSPFASKLLEGLQSYGGRDNIITLMELYGWLERVNPEPILGSFGTDEFYSDFVFIDQIKGKK